ncbi:tetracycline repressor-like protein [Murinocardiopsis flavida]|uniref:Tetracycline repressor-like protein n=1 Tax=Murinocardiopsis flavida TaxID=645275 RepID=A0A2P8DS56_9ACTN|nr:GntR family transcriptional regulator [Murinocardiopsis flavida]PSL00054.1 tetracycline repressor-like protein [Murinocardiopsis flavida]
MNAAAPDDRPSVRIAAAVRERIANGDLRPGERAPSTRQIVREWGVAMATASRAIAILRDEGLVVTRPGSGTVVRGRAGPAAGGRRGALRGLTRARVVAAGIGIADREGMEAVSMRRLSGTLQVAPMSLYHHVAGRDELEFLMVRAVFQANPLPARPPSGWRARIEAVYRLQWRLYRAHPWLAELLSVNRPPLAPEAMEHSEWTLAALHEIPLGAEERMRAALALPSLVRGLALGALGEIRAERETRMRTGQWWRTVDAEAEAIVRSGRYPRLTEVDASAADRLFGVDGVDDLLDHALAHYLDGLAARVADGRRSG